MTPDSDETWLLANGERDGQPFSVRAREPRKIEINREQKWLLVASLGYAGSDELLPTEGDYENISTFEGQAFDAPNGDPKLLWVETGSGVIRYFAYTANVDAAVAKLEGALGSMRLLEFEFDEDADWEIYRERIGNLSKA